MSRNKNKTKKKGEKGLIRTQLVTYWDDFETAGEIEEEQRAGQQQL